jgi:hypothetical protein
MQTGGKLMGRKKGNKGKIINEKRQKGEFYIKII